MKKSRLEGAEDGRRRCLNTFWAGVSRSTAVSGCSIPLEKEANRITKAQAAAHYT
jgi:hypothetical protein